MIAQKRVWWKKKDAKKFYDIHKDQPFYKDLITFMTSGPIVLQVLEGENAIAKNREVMGATNPVDAAAGSIRKDFGVNYAAELGAWVRQRRDRQARDRPLLQEGRDRRLGRSRLWIDGAALPAHLLRSIIVKRLAGRDAQSHHVQIAYRSGHGLPAWQRSGFGFSPHPVRRRQQAEAGCCRASRRQGAGCRPRRSVGAACFLKRMPKGADLHNHLDGAVYAETFIRVGGEDGLCVDPVAKSFTKSQPIKSGAEPDPVCEAGDVPAAEVPKNQRLYDELVDSFSMRGFVPSEGETAHDHFFGTFAKFGGTDPRHTGEFLHEVTTRAAAQNEQYLELMETPTWHRLNDITKDVAWRDDLGALRDELLAKGLAEDIPAARAFWDQAEAVRSERGHCGEPDAAPACRVKTRYIYQVFRNTPKELVFAQTAVRIRARRRPTRAWWRSISSAARTTISMADYAEHMRMIGFLRELYPEVHVSLHAGELAPGLVPPEGLCCHVRLAVEQARPTASAMAST